MARAAGGRVEYTGLCMDMLEAMAKSLNFT